MRMRSAVRQLVGEMDEDVDAAIVEGGRDRTALERAGFTGDIYTCCENTDGIVGLARRIAAHHSAVAVLTDFDTAGKELHGKLRDALPARQVHGIWRQKLAELLAVNGHRDIESINNILDS
ncbi:MAG: hypothetical protein SVW77_00430 [Candidatus Nanohaloarchaea archaeon]|nr:hypothetical protein [Candidatus Nanohaloarchaea archaeon]